jgi:hypothetical protein
VCLRDLKILIRAFLLYFGFRVSREFSFLLLNAFVKSLTTKAHSQCIVYVNHIMYQGEWCTHTLSGTKRKRQEATINLRNTKLMVLKEWSTMLSFMSQVNQHCHCIVKPNPKETSRLLLLTFQQVRVKVSMNK